MPNENTIPANDLDLGFDLMINKIRRQELSYGTWVRGQLHGHHFEALIFAEHACEPSYELEQSRISKLRIQRLADRKVMYNWDRGLDVPATDATVEAIVDFLAAGLAEYIEAR